MSEEILKALMQLFAIISKQDDGSTANQRRFVEAFLASQLNNQKVQEYLKDYDEKVGTSDKEPAESAQGGGRLTSVKDSVRTLAIGRKINKTLTQKQKVIVLVRLFEMLMSERLFTDQRMSIIRTIANVFNISTDELELISGFVMSDSPENAGSQEILIIGKESNGTGSSEFKPKHLVTQGLDNNIIILRIKSADLYFLKYLGSIDIFLNGLTLNREKIYLLPQGSTLRVPKGTIYYNDVVSRFLSEEVNNRLSFKAENISYKFPNGKTALTGINIAEEYGLIGIMGASGSGKTTLLNVLSGIESPSGGNVTLNGLDIHKDTEKAKSLIGYIAQDDFLIEDLTVFQNLYYNAKLCFSDLSDEEINKRVENTLTNFGLFEIKDIKVGSPLNKKISGGQRKRLNIALEFIREPAVLFVDEPTSGLSSRDSENVMDLLKELSLQMKLIFVVIHQPSSDIFKMFDRLFILDTGGYPIYYGNPIEAVMYFKHATRQVNAEVGECHSCGNVNPEILFNIIESKEVDEFGRFTRQRIKDPVEWNELYCKNFTKREIEDVNSIPKRSFQIPGWFEQIRVFIKRDVLSKISNTQYLLISMLEAPLMALFLTLIIRYLPDNKLTYIFRENENIPPYIFMSIVIALFVGLSVSAEEIFKDRKILRRERFLNLSRSSYLVSKVIILFSISAAQMLIYVLVGNSILGLKGMTFEYWAVLFAVSCFANMLGLNISSAFNSAVTIYILIPLLIIPQMALGGAMFNFDKINKVFGGGKGSAPLIADVMASRWSYEALAVAQFRSNRFEKNFFEIEQIQSSANYRQAFYYPELNKIVDESLDLKNKQDEESAQLLKSNLNLLRNSFESEASKFNNITRVSTLLLTPENYNENVAREAHDFLNALNDNYIIIFNKMSRKKDEIAVSLQKSSGGTDNYTKLSNTYQNDFLSEIVKKTNEKNKIIRDGDRLIQNFEPVYLLPENNGGISLRAHFFAPAKYIFGLLTDTLVFNLVVIWMMSLMLYVSLYFDLLRKAINAFDFIKSKPSLK